MPKLDVEIAEQLPEPQEGMTYKITEATLVTTQVRSYKGLRVNMETDDGKKVAVMLWMRNVASEKSKLGSFVHTLGAETDAWIGRKIRMVAWRQNNRQIEVVP